MWLHLTMHMLESFWAYLTFQSASSAYIKKKINKLSAKSEIEIYSHISDKLESDELYSSDTGKT